MLGRCVRGMCSGNMLQGCYGFVLGSVLGVRCEGCVLGVC